MSCTCTEDKEVLPGGVIIGRNKVTCQECLDRAAAEDKKRRSAEKKAAIRELELKSLRKLFDGESLTAVNAERAKLRGEINQLEGV
jgi:hypothetical protein